jgi:hypothetical protein
LDALDDKEAVWAMLKLCFWRGCFGDSVVFVTGALSETWVLVDFVKDCFAGLCCADDGLGTVTAVAEARTVLIFVDDVDALLCWSDVMFECDALVAGLMLCWPDVMLVGDVDASEAVFARLLALLRLCRCR